MEILNILYSNNLIAVYLIGAILVVILIIIVISSINTTPKNEEKILKDPTEEKEDSLSPKIIEEEQKKLEIPIIKEEQPNIEITPIQEEQESKIDNIVENLYQKSMEEELVPPEIEDKDLNTFLEEFEVPSNVIEEVTKEESLVPIIEEEIETPKLKEDTEPKENVEDMLKRLYNLRQNEKEDRKKAILTEIIELKKQLDETLKANNCNYELEHAFEYNKELADYYLFNKDVEFPKLK